MQKPQISEVVISSLGNLPAPITALGVTLSGFSPIWAGIIGVTAGFYSVYTDLATTKGSELLEFVSANKEQFSAQIIATDRFKSSFINILEQYIRESSETKRLHLRNLLLSIGSNIELSEDFDTKLISIIQQMTDYESKIFGVIVSYDPIPYKKILDSKAHRDILETYLTDRERLEEAWCSLSTYGLITIEERTQNVAMIVNSVTRFGKIYYDLVIK